MSPRVALPTGWLPDAAVPDANDDDLTFVRSALTGLTGTTDARLLIAVSGGPDSMALLDLTKASWAGPVFAATVDHGLRAASAGEAALVARFCQSIDVPHAILRPPAPITGNLQSAARAVRYTLLHAEADRISAPWIVTAHHADDQLETMLMRLARGSGVDGLSGVRARNGRVIRPLLSSQKKGLRDYCVHRNLPFVDDPSNLDPDFDRVRMRMALETFDLIDPVMAARSAQALADASDALDWVAAGEARRALMPCKGGVELHRHQYPAALLRRLVLLCLNRVQPGIAPRGAALDRLIATLESGDQGMVGNVLCRGGDVWRFTPAPRRSGI